MNLAKENTQLRKELAKQVQQNLALSAELQRLTGIERGWPLRLRTASAYLALGESSPNALWRGVEHGLYRPGVEVFDCNRKRHQRAEGQRHKPLWRFDIAACLERQREVG